MAKSNSVAEKAKKYALAFPEYIRELIEKVYADAWEECKRERKRGYDFDPEILDPRFRRQMLEWLEYKKEIKDMYKSDASVKKCEKMLIEMSGGSIQKAQEIIDFSIANNYKGLYQKDKGYGSRKGTGTASGKGNGEKSIFDLAEEVL